MKRYALMLALALAVGTVGWGKIGDVRTDPWRTEIYRTAFGLAIRTSVQASEPIPMPPGTIWSHIGDDHAAVLPPVPLAVDQPSGFGDCMCDRFPVLYQGGSCPFCGRYVPTGIFLVVD